MSASVYTVGDRHYSVVVRYDEESSVWLADVPTLGFMTYGDTPDEAYAMAEEAIIGRLETAAAHGQEIPIEEHPVELRTVAV